MNGYIDLRFTCSGTGTYNDTLDIYVLLSRKKYDWNHMFYFFARSLNNTIYIYTYTYIYRYICIYIIHRSYHTRNWGEGAFAPPHTRWPREGVDPPPLILAISYSGESHLSKMSLVKVVANDSSYCSKFFLF